MDLRKGKQAHSPFQYLTQTFKIALMGTFVFFCFYAFNQIDLTRFFPIKTVRIYGINRLNQTEVQTLLLPLVQRGFFTVNVDYIRNNLLQLPWVSDIFVRRTWPDKVEITVIEKKAVANWDGESLLSQGGELFTPNRETYPTNLPYFIGPDGKQIIMLQYFNSMNRLLTPLHAKISYLELTPYLTWKLKLDNGIILQIGHKDILTRLDHFVKVYPKIVGKHAEDVEYIDLRYPNGVAVRWKSTINT